MEQAGLPTRADPHTRARTVKRLYEPGSPPQGQL